MRDGLRLAFGTLTVLPVAPPRNVDRGSAGAAMGCAPLVGLVLAVVTAGVLWLLGWPMAGPRLTPLSVSPLLAAGLVVGVLALLTRGLHLDGLADTADGLGSGRPAPQALELMRRGDVGPFGVATLVLILLVQVAALTELLATGTGPAGLAVALVTSRLVLPVACSRGVPAARRDGLGSAVAGSVSRPRLCAAALLTLALVLAASWVVPAPAVRITLAFVVAAGIALAAGTFTCRWCLRRFGGITGDVLGCCVEVTFTTALVVLALG